MGCHDFDNRKCSRLAWRYKHKGVRDCYCLLLCSSNFEDAVRHAVRCKIPVRNIRSFGRMSSMSAIDTEKLDKAILAQIRRADGAQEWSVTSWQVHVQAEVGALPDHAEVVSAMKRLRADGLIRLRKNSKEYGGEYSGNEADDWWFFGYYTFQASITDQGRRFWNVAVRPLGFQMPA